MDSKEEIRKKLEKIRLRNLENAAKLTKAALLTDYAHLTFQKNGLTVWSEAFQTALNENELLHIPAGEVYWLDRTVVIPSNRRIEADPAALICLTEDTRVLMLRNARTQDGTRRPISGPRDENISISGGIWAESNRCRRGYGDTGMYDEHRSFFGVSTCMLFNNLDGLTLTDMVFAHAAGFAVQVGDASNAVFQNIRFHQCYADGLHINGNVQNLLAEHISGQVGDDLVALNMYDWQNSSVNFGPLDTAWIEDLELSADSFYKALRIQPGIYEYDDGSQVDCAIRNIVIRKVRGINTFKLYFQTPAYKIGTPPERGDTGSGDGIWFEDIHIDLDKPIDPLAEYLSSDPVRGYFAAFEVGANLGSLSLENIRLTLHPEYPLSQLLTVGPKSCILNGDTEVFDPYINSRVEMLILKNIQINGETVENPENWIKAVSFDDINRDGHSTARGSIERIVREIP